MYLLDTHILFWWVTVPARLTPAQRRALGRSEAAQRAFAISSISLWELAMLAKRNRIDPPGPVDLWLAELESDSGMEVMPISGRIAVEAVRLGANFPADPADRIIAATAICHGLTLLTADQRIRAAGEVAIL